MTKKFAIKKIMKTSATFAKNLWEEKFSLVFENGNSSGNASKKLFFFALLKQSERIEETPLFFEHDDILYSQNALE